MTAKTQKQRSAEFRARKASTPEVRGIYANADLHDYIKQKVLLFGLAPQLTIATKRATKEKA